MPCFSACKTHPKSTTRNRNAIHNQVLGDRKFAFNRDARGVLCFKHWATISWIFVAWLMDVNWRLLWMRVDSGSLREVGDWNRPRQERPVNRLEKKLGKPPSMSKLNLYLVKTFRWKSCNRYSIIFSTNSRHVVHHCVDVYGHFLVNSYTMLHTMHNSNPKNDSC